MLENQFRWKFQTV